MRPCFTIRARRNGWHMTKMRTLANQSDPSHDEQLAELSDGNARGGVQSIEVGASLLAVLAHADAGLSLTALASATGMPASKAHRYLTSFVRAGIIERDAASGLFDPGPLARALGLAALRRQDTVLEAASVMEALRDELEENVVLSVWDEGAPAMIRVEEHSRAFSIKVRIGARLPLLTSAQGQIFAAWLPPALTRIHIARELQDNSDALRRIGVRSETDLAKLLAKIRRDGVATLVGGIVEGISGTTAPVFRYPGTLAAAMTVLTIGKCSPQLQRTIQTALKAAAAELSERLGAPIPPKTSEG